MHAVIAIPESVVEGNDSLARLMQPVAGVPLLMRSVLTASRAGATEALIVFPLNASNELMQQCSENIAGRGAQVRAFRIPNFEPVDPASWGQLPLSSGE